MTVLGLRGHGLRQRVRRRIVVILASLGVLVTGLWGGGVGIATVAAVICPTGQHQAFVTLTTHTTWKDYVEGYDGGGIPHIFPGHTDLSNVLSGTVTYTYCVGKVSNVWGVRSNASGHESNLYDLVTNTSTKKITAINGVGMMLRAAKVNTSSVVVEPMICNARNPNDLWKAILTVPIPGSDFVVAIAQYIVGLYTPDSTTTCKTFADETASLHFATNGDTSASGFTRNYYSTYAITSGPCVTSGYQCTWVDQYTVTFSAP